MKSIIEDDELGAPLPPFRFCESVTAGGVGCWHLRKTGASLDLRSNGNYIDTTALCGHPRKDWGWDIGAPVNEFHLRHSCPECVAAYRLGMDALHTVVDVILIKDRGMCVCFAGDTSTFAVGDTLTRGREKWIASVVDCTLRCETVMTGILLVLERSTASLSVPLAAFPHALATWPRIGDVLARLAPVTAL